MMVPLRSAANLVSFPDESNELDSFTPWLSQPEDVQHRDEHTRRSAAKRVHVTRVALLISSAHLSDEFVTRGHKYDREKGQEQGWNASDMPLWENDTQILRRPCKEHLHRSVSIQAVVGTMGAVHS